MITILKYFKNYTVSFTGHRPHKTNCFFSASNYQYKNLRKQTKMEIEKAILFGYKIFLTGMALGFDIMCAELVLELKKKYTHIQLFGIIPCENQCKYWTQSEKNKYNDILSKLDKTLLTSKTYHSNCMIKRNKFMVDNSYLIIAFFNGSNGGTKRTIDYAKNQNKKIIIIQEKNLKVDSL